jgi:hypothetical protein
VKKQLQILQTRRSQPQGSPLCVLGNRRLSRTSTAVSQRADPQGSVPGCSDTRPVQPLQTLHESRQEAHTTDATNNGSLAIQYMGIRLSTCITRTARILDWEREHRGAELAARPLVACFPMID